MNNMKLGGAILVVCGLFIIGIGVVGILNGDTISDFLRNTLFGFAFLLWGAFLYLGKIKKKK